MLEGCLGIFQQDYFLFKIIDVILKNFIDFNFSGNAHRFVVDTALKQLINCMLVIQFQGRSSTVL